MPEEAEPAACCPRSAPAAHNESSLMLTADHRGRRRGGVRAVKRHVSTAVVARARDWPDDLPTTWGHGQPGDACAEGVRGAGDTSQPTLHGPKGELGRQRVRLPGRQPMGCAAVAPCLLSGLLREASQQTLRWALTGNAE